MRLKLSSISKKFDHKMILEDSSFQFEQGKIYGLLGRIWRLSTQSINSSVVLSTGWPISISSWSLAVTCTSYSFL